MSTSDPLRLGVVGLGRAFMLTLPSLQTDKRVRLVAAATPSAAAREAFSAAFDARAYASVAALAADPLPEAVYIASPHRWHAEHAEVLAAAGKHLLVEKPLAVTLADGARIVAAARAANVHLITGPSHSFDAPVLAARALIERGELGRVRMILALNYTDFLYRPRRPDELSTAEGGGVVFSQAVHHVDIVRLLAGVPALTVTARTGAWDSARPTEGVYAALVTFEGGLFASLTYSGYAHFDSDVWQGWIGELGHPKDPDSFGSARKRLADIGSPQEEARLKDGQAYAAAEALPPAPHCEHFGPIIVSCDGGDLRITPEGVHVYGSADQHFLPVSPNPAPRSPVIHALIEAVRHDRPPRQAGAWGLASLEVCCAILQAAETGMSIRLRHQR